MTDLRGKTVVVGVSGGIAAYKTCTFVSRLVQSGAQVHVVMTHNATQFVAPLTFETLSHNRVVCDTFDRNFTWEVEHVSLAKKADLAVIAPATANAIAKFAVGIADDFLSTFVLACKCPVLFAPAMNSAMLNNPATQNNIRILCERGFVPICGDEGYLACGDSGKGRMAEPEALFAAVEKVFMSKHDLIGKTVLVTAGATRTAIDPVRFMSNRSSGKMGYCLAEAAYNRGARVIFIKGSTDKFDINADWITENVTTTADMLSAVKKHAASADICIMAAAPCDYELVVPFEQKIKSQSFSVEFKKTVDIAEWIGKNKRGKLVIFAAETENAKENAVKKLQEKNADMVVLNDVTVPGAGFDVDTNIVTIITDKGETSLPIMKKRELADVILDNAVRL